MPVLHLERSRFPSSHRSAGTLSGFGLATSSEVTGRPDYEGMPARRDSENQYHSAPRPDRVAPASVEDLEQNLAAGRRGGLRWSAVLALSLSQWTRVRVRGASESCFCSSSIEVGLFLVLLLGVLVPAQSVHESAVRSGRMRRRRRRLRRARRIVAWRAQGCEARGHTCHASSLSQPRTSDDRPRKRVYCSRQVTSPTR
ncbi:hypothetical protein B0H15DRAFT_237598 [Mycena belliarum]|uniref:Uncharacterized protein n=1 Tax=Mycena belliarum TaxID=1033014 RepID=A0AAD6U5C1_9AGAR|nr:hypothetical protein B0H15DRAFT_237598 [Mycena belliae]